MAEETCPLCEAEQLTRWYADDEVCWVADCTVCDTPMVVWKTHGVDPSEDQLAHMLELLGQAADERFGQGGWHYDRLMRQIPDHFHAHGRDPSWWARLQQRHRI